MSPARVDALLVIGAASAWLPEPGSQILPMRRQAASVPAPLWSRWISCRHCCLSQALATARRDFKCDSGLLSVRVYPRQSQEC